MGRHRRSAAGRAGGAAQPGGAGSGSTRGTAPYLNPEAYAEARARSEAYLFGTDGTGGAAPSAGPGGSAGPDGAGAPPPRPASRRRRKKAASVPVRTGLLGVSAAVALGAVAVATGAVPGLDGLRIGGGPGGSDKVQAADSPANTPGGQGGTSGTVGSGGARGESAGTGGSASPTAPSASASASKKPSASASATPAKTPSKQTKPTAAPSKTTKPTPSRTATEEPAQTEEPAGGSVPVSEAAAAEAQVLTLVNEERAKVGCTPVAADSALTALAEDFSEAMAAQDFFDHTDPSGATPWDRAEAAGISNLGGENIARGQADAAAVMDAWMNSEGHRANILNCDFKTLGVGVHFGSGGPWWTQDFGY
ncbi:CAP domain-containing protein [Streptomyces sp. NPDC023723]|uniref:CAP domain-containing protein n=1 Tax=Streptomyces sp. NPDC023723 TaxID=3154323 RepID=UPI0033C9CCF1